MWVAVPSAWWAMDATLANAVVPLDATETVLVAHFVLELRIAFAVPTAVRVAVKSIGMSISTSRRCATPVDAMVNSNAVAAEVALRHWGG